jgi:para-nitrobenzyl esterase
MASEQINRRRFISMAGGAAVCAANARADTAPIAKTTYGQIRGSSADGVILFKGVAYAGSPSGENRFKPAPKLTPWTGVRDAVAYGDQSIQPPDPGWPKSWKPAPASEDCLFLNIWTSGIADGKKRPVMFYSHGGGFANGNGGAEVFSQNLGHDGSALAKNYDVVVVTHNHRLGILGSLYLGELFGEEYAASGAAGMLDIVAALEWVRDNIEAFGGDPGNVMIFGESGGASKTATLTALPSAQGMYHKASMESLPSLRLTTRDAGTELAKTVLAKLGVKKARDLAKVSAHRIQEVQKELAGTDPMFFQPVVDGHYIPNHPYDPVAPALSAKIPMMIGTNKDETILFFRQGSEEVFSLDEEGMRSRLFPILRERTNHVVDVYHHSRPNASPADIYIAITTALFMWNVAITLAERKVALNAAPIYMYLFAYESEVPVSAKTHYPMKAAHAMEVAFKFDHPDNNPDAGKRPERYQVANNMSAAWAAFARSSNPNHAGIPKWPAYTLGQRATMILDSECKLVNDPYQEERLVWLS